MSVIINWLTSIQSTYGVNPYIFAAIYIGAIPLFWIGIYWLVKNIKSKKSVNMPVLFMLACAVSSYTYLLFTGNDIPLWVYLLIAIMIGYAGYTVYDKVKKTRLQNVKTTI